MKNLYNNIYNHSLGRDEPKLKLFKYAGLMLTYKCPASCAFCYYNSCPEVGGLMSVESAVSTWSSLIELSGAEAKVHFTGGEPFLYFDHLLEIVNRGRQLGLGGFDCVETNGYWADDEDLIRKRLKLLDEAGMSRLKISRDIFHAEFIEADCVRRLADISAQVLGPERVLVRWEKYLQEPVSFSNVSESERKKLYLQGLMDFPTRFTGRSAFTLAPLVANKTIEEIAAENCRKSYLSARGVHIDPFGNVFNGLCSGIVIGNINDKGLDEIWLDYDPCKMEMISPLFEGGPVSLLPEAESLGYRRLDRYADKCHLCTELRQFFFDKGKYKSIIKPAECYYQR